LFFGGACVHGFDLALVRETEVGDDDIPLCIHPCVGVDHLLEVCDVCACVWDAFGIVDLQEEGAAVAEHADVHVFPPTAHEDEAFCVGVGFDGGHDDLFYGAFALLFTTFL
jgi:hypothetical protein